MNTTLHETELDHNLIKCYFIQYENAMHYTIVQVYTHTQIDSYSRQHCSFFYIKKQHWHA